MHVHVSFLYVFEVKETPYLLQCCAFCGGGGGDGGGGWGLIVLILVTVILIVIVIHLLFG